LGIVRDSKEFKEFDDKLFKLQEEKKEADDPSLPCKAEF
jgi:hypothetical protein